MLPRHHSQVQTQAESQPQAHEAQLEKLPRNNYTICLEAATSTTPRNQISRLLRPLSIPYTSSAFPMPCQTSTELTADWRRMEQKIGHSLDF